MSFTAKTLIALGLLTLATACAQQEEVVVVEPAPIMQEPTMSKF
jgi:hypothetical protein